MCLVLEQEEDSSRLARQRQQHGELGILLSRDRCCSEKNSDPFGW